MVPFATLSGGPPLIIAHRGASGYLPEHTLEAYGLAIALGADVVEPDVVATGDGALICRHEPMLGATTDVADRPEFAARRTTRRIDDVAVTDWFASDFTLGEIKRLRARQPMADRDHSHDGRYAIPTLDEAIDLVQRESRGLGRTVAIYPETKHPAYHRTLGLALEERLLAALARVGWTGRDAPAIVQSFDADSLRAIRARCSLRLARLVGVGVSPDAPAIAAYADGLACWKGDLLPPSETIARAHAAGLFVHAWTFRDERRWLAAEDGGDPLQEYRRYYALGIDGVFSDHPDTAIRARDAARP